MKESPWKSQVVVTKNERSKKRLVIDHSETINRFTQLDAYPLPNVDELVNKIAKYKYFSTIDLKSAYHQIPLRKEDRPYTAFEADGGFHQFTRMPFGITNGVACFQRSMENFIFEEEIDDTFGFMDNVTICGMNENEHDENLEKFNEAAKRRNLTFNKDKCTFRTTSLNFLGYNISQGEIKPDVERLKPLRYLPIPHNSKSLKRVICLFSYYSKWIKNFSDKIAPLVKSKSFPLSLECQNAFQNLKVDIENSVVCAIDENEPFELETDTSDVAILGVLNQNGRPVAFYSRTQQGPELKHPPTEKEACAIIESVRHWRHLLTGKHFKLITDQKSVSLMFDQHMKSKIKNDKIYRWRLELSCYSFDIIYRKGIENVLPDTFSRVYCSALSNDSLKSLHESLCHPGVTRMTAFGRSRNLPFSVEDIRSMIKQYTVCQRCKPSFYKPVDSHITKATKPFERLNIDFKGPLPSTTKNIYMLNIIDEYSRFPFVYPCPTTDTNTVTACLSQLFSLFGMPAYVHSDRGPSLMSNELKQWLREKGIATSRTTPYNPQGNGQTER